MFIRAGEAEAAGSLVAGRGARCAPDDRPRGRVRWTTCAGCRCTRRAASRDLYSSNGTGMARPSTSLKSVEMPRCSDSKLRVTSVSFTLPPETASALTLGVARNVSRKRAMEMLVTELPHG